ncbi:uncharacterized protein PV09_07652 [Verruconis gallopava]|uniref:SprT-like domain-containing protein n=1 Tax=Verruconis gallopava TaxID=253628 RepID=A0A0D2A3C9_9PEZI|nr:uncharacterized protein PV09_07652 [Verruconis gallopava]KIW00905.1 hypothetical protein PV09_07652 [Verruconis gallopava]
MARIHISSEDELPELGELLRPKQRRTRVTTPSLEEKPSNPQVTSAKEQSHACGGKQRPLKKLNSTNSLFGPFDASKGCDSAKLPRPSCARKSPRKIQRSKPIEVFQDDESDAPDDASSSGDGSFQFTDDSGSDGESWLGKKRADRSPFKRLLKSRAKSSPKSPRNLDDRSLIAPSFGATDLPNPFVGPRLSPSKSVALPSTSSSRPTSSSSAVDNAAILHYTPPKKVSPVKKTSESPPIAPPLDQPPSPSKKLNSPSKGRLEIIPRAPIQESLDAFWSQDVVNEWNEQYSPRKMLTSPRKNRFITPTSEDENGPPSPSTSPRRRSPQKGTSPLKSKEAKQMKKTWDARKKGIAAAFFKELDDTIAGGQLSKMTADTGGVHLIWSKKLNTTAGRANWRREKVRDLQADGTTVVSYKHTANIELAEKVIDDEVRLVNVVAHEFCHLCNFMISGIRDAPHGKEFKEWAKKCSRAFGSRGIEVTTKHSYDIDYKYVWECVDCLTEFKRHSKSIDPLKQACGACKGRLVQTKPVPRDTKTSEYQLFVKEHCQTIKRDNPGLSHGSAMEMLAQMWKEKKAEDRLNNREKSDLEHVVKELQIITLDD